MDCAARSVGNAAEEDAAEGLLPQAVAGLVEKLVARIGERGYATHDELRAALPLATLDATLSASARAEGVRLIGGDAA